MSEEKLLAQYTAAMEQWGSHPVVLQSTIVEMSLLIGPLQLALRHPLFPRGSRHYVERFIQGFIEQVRTKDLVLAQVLERGNDPHHDVPATRRRRTRR